VTKITRNDARVLWRNRRDAPCNISTIEYHRREEHLPPFDIHNAWKPETFIKAFNEYNGM
jgi:hypothetical protein